MIEVTLINKDQRVTYECYSHSFIGTGTETMKLRLRNGGTVYATVRRWDRVEIEEVEEP